MVNFLGWLVAGLVVGAIARLVMPGRQPMGVIMTMLLGIVGALIGGGIWWLIWQPDTSIMENIWPGYLISILGSVLVLWLASGASRRTA
jgi:uncharacterized membrane protein YeaQ/YmgE (transglycosylase-associated protein family)